jgi:hypothetical protein
VTGEGRDTLPDEHRKASSDGHASLLTIHLSLTFTLRRAWQEEKGESETKQTARSCKPLSQSDRRVARDLKDVRRARSQRPLSAISGHQAVGKSLRFTTEADILRG